MTSRTFVVRITESPARVVIEDVQGRRHAVTADLASAARQMGTWLESPPSGLSRDGGEESRAPGSP